VKCIVSGGTGFIGRRLVDTLLKNGHYAAVWSRTPGEETRTAVGSFYWDPLTGEPQEESLTDFDAVIHLAGEPVLQRWTPEAKRRIRDSRVMGTRRLVSAISKVRRKPAALICASAIGYYGGRGDEVLTESSGKGAGFLADLCEEWEREADAAAELGLRVVKIRIGVALDKKGGALQAMLPAFQMFAGGTLGSGKQWMSWIHLQDLVRMFRHAVENPISGVWNGTAPNPATNAEFTKALGKALKRPAVFRIPTAALKLVYGEAAEVLVESQRVIPEAPKVQGFEWLYSHVGEALRDLLN
jgi:uncharacterized protein (TIGR01777 family)